MFGYTLLIPVVNQEPPDSRTLMVLEYSLCPAVWLQDAATHPSLWNPVQETEMWHHMTSWGPSSMVIL